jgi:hypothetical protein
MRISTNGEQHTYTQTVQYTYTHTHTHYRAEIKYWLELGVQMGISSPYLPNDPEKAVDKVFKHFDKEHAGTLTYSNFCKMYQRYFKTSV